MYESSHFFRLSLSALVLLFAVLFTSSYHSSPWLSTTIPIFLQPPPPLPLTAVPPVQGCQDLKLTTQEPRENAAIVLLLREQDLDELVPTLENFERRFNGNFRYPYVFLSTPDDPPLSNAFRTRVQEILPVGAKTEYAIVPEEHWSLPKWMNAEKLRRGFAEMEKAGVQYGGREGYHHMCRFYSGFFARQAVLAKYDWYWRLEPGVRFYCSITYDPFRFMAINNKVYGFVITIVETPNTIPTLFSTIQDYVKDSNISVGPGMWDFMTKKTATGQEEYNLCHFWTNFEIGDLRFFRGEEYQGLFDTLDKSGGFYTERWGDAPIRSLALGLFADLDQVHYFDDMAYKHDYFVHCPQTKGLGCDCDCPKFGKGNEDVDNNIWYSCVPNWKAAVAKHGRFSSN